MVTKEEIDAFIKNNYLINPVALVKDIYDFVWKAGRKKGDTSKKTPFHELKEPMKTDLVVAAKKIMKNYYVIPIGRL